MLSGPALEQHGIKLPIAWGNRNWHPFLTDALRELALIGARRVLALVLAAYSSYSSCRQYREDIERARAAVGPSAPAVDKIRVFFNHPGFIAANADRLREAMEKIPVERRSTVACRLYGPQHSAVDGANFSLCRAIERNLPTCV